MNTSDSTRFEIHLSDDPERFLALPEEMHALLGGEWTEQLNGLDQSYWDLDVEGVRITLHREHYLGVCVYGPRSPEADLIAERIRTHFLPI